GQLAVQQQVGDFQEAALFGKLLDGVAAVAQDSPVSIEVGDGALAGGRIQERGVVTEQAEVLGTGLDLPQVDGADRAVIYGERIGLSGPVIGYGKSLVGHRVWRLLPRRGCSALCIWISTRK